MCIPRSLPGMLFWHRGPRLTKAGPIFSALSSASVISRTTIREKKIAKSTEQRAKSKDLKDKIKNFLLFALCALRFSLSLGGNVIKIAPSLLSADFMRLGEEIK